MKRIILLFGLLLFLTTVNAQPRLVSDGPGRAHLIVEGQPMLILGGELSNSAATCRADIDSVMPRMARLGLNTVLVPAQWDLIEPEEGHYDFSLIDESIRQARSNGLKVVFLWFGAWKNSMSCYAPLWVKRDFHRFPRACGKSGRPQEIVTAFSENLFRADSTVFTRLIRHIRDIDSKEQTVVMMQVENEIGMLESARDHCPLAESVWRKPVPKDFLEIYEKANKGLTTTARHGLTWQQLLGESNEGDEQFQAYWYAHYVERLACAAKRIYALPLYVNAAMNSRGRKPGEYPSAGPLVHLFPIWKQVATHVDLCSPDIYDTGFKNWARRYATADNPLFIPESRCCVNSGVRALYTFGEHEAVGFCPFAIDQSGAGDTHQVSAAYHLLHQLTPLLLRYRGKQQIHGVLFDQQDRDTTLIDGRFALACHHVFTSPWDPRAKDGSTWREGGAVIIRLSADEYIIAGSGVVVEFKDKGQAAVRQQALGEDGFALKGNGKKQDEKTQKGRPTESLGASAMNKKRGEEQQRSAYSSPRYVGLGSVSEIRVDTDGHWSPVRYLNGDQTHQGRHVRIGIDDYQILHVKVY